MIFDVKPFIAPSPVAVAQTLLDKRFDMLMANLLPTAIEAVVRLPARQSRGDPPRHGVRPQQDRWRRRFFPIVVMVNTIPVVAKAPILVLLMGNGMEPKIAIAALICFFPTLVNMVRGLRDGATRRRWS